jgi:hypothetical protein
MRVNTVQAIIAILVVGGFIVVTGVLALWPLLSESDVGASTYSSYLKDISGVYSGIVGVIIGYYFAQQSTSQAGGAPRAAEEPKPLR